MDDLKAQFHRVLIANVEKQCQGGLTDAEAAQRMNTSLTNLRANKTKWRRHESGPRDMRMSSCIDLIVGYKIPFEPLMEVIGAKDKSNVLKKLGSYLSREDFHKLAQMSESDWKRMAGIIRSFLAEE